MLNTVQCHQPLPVGASGSYIVMAKLLVPCGAPDQDSAGERSPPLQLPPLNTWASGIVPPLAKSGVVTVNPAAQAGAATTQAASPEIKARILSSPSDVADEA